MFPEIFRDEVFRLETRRLWLRWPTLGDATSSTAGAQSADGMARSAGSALHDAATIAAWRAAAAEGTALHLALVTKPDHSPVGILHLVANGSAGVEIDGDLDPSQRGRGLMTEAIQALAHAVFSLADVTVVTASPAVDNPEGRGVLEHCGFTYAGSGMRRSRTGRGLVPCDHFRLDHATWSTLQGWAMPGFGAYVARCIPPPPGRERCPLTL